MLLADRIQLGLAHVQRLGNAGGVQCLRVMRIDVALQQLRVVAAACGLQAGQAHLAHTGLHNFQAGRHLTGRNPVQAQKSLIQRVLVGVPGASGCHPPPLLLARRIVKHLPKENGRYRAPLLRHRQGHLIQARMAQVFAAHLRASHLLCRLPVAGMTAFKAAVLLHDEAAEGRLEAAGIQLVPPFVHQGKLDARQKVQVVEQPSQALKIVFVQHAQPAFSSVLFIIAHLLEKRKILLDFGKGFS